ncbi:hypothetical protein DAPPUDRAFT_301175 [Daphnia pulex]|uniref:Uncharacterized protein n=1 Tax=Daphnia pulex TaxID=6669 RepID=E9HGS8_DAPPU|nr:hypothetical protein DAPPUDRAFT_301175 [Daphnia pulex]|eukprot:EFX69012.1 hypothetical protein DAPPUDRAFT_301175 [Daphnia pulex]
MKRNTCLWLGVVLLLIIPLTKGLSEAVQLISFDREVGRSNKFSLLRPFQTRRYYKKHPIYGTNQFLIIFDKILELSMCMVICSVI